MKKTITEVETAIENRIAELEEEYELDIYDRNDIREEEYQKAGWRHDPFPEELEEEDEEEEKETAADETAAEVADEDVDLDFSLDDDLDDFDMDLGDDLAGVDLDDTDNAPDDNE